jgi:hypothetical protein
MERILVELLVVLLVAGAIFAVVRLVAGGLGLPGWVVQATGIVLAVVLIIWLIRLLPLAGIG